MEHPAQEFVGTGFDVDRFHVRPVARANVLWHEGSSWGIGASYLRAARIEVADTEGEGEGQVFPIPDRQLQVRLAAIAIVAVAFVIGRMRR